MERFQRIIVHILAAVLLLSCLPVWALRAQALETGTEDAQTVTVTRQTAPDVDLPENETLYEGYVERLFYGNDSVSLLSELARDQLNPLGQQLYDFLKAGIQQIAAGETASAVLVLQAARAADWGAETAFTTSDANAAFSSFLSQFEIERVFRALLHDCPYELYWYDKVTGLKESASFSVSGSRYTVNSVSFFFAVAGNYQPADYDANSPTFNTGAAVTAVKAADNAKAIAASYEGYSDYATLKGYKDEICALVSYDKAAASFGNFSTNSDPWQLIYVFDGDPYTNVVCEGYSKAFQYLCDMTEFLGDVTCYTVTGTSNSSGHMWNIVTIGAENYLADVTNSDSGTAGQSGSLFLTGGPGSIAAGYTFSNVKYLYDTATTSLWGTGADSILALAGSSYDPTIDGVCGASLTWALNEATNTLHISGSGSMYDYDSSSAPWKHLAGHIAAVNVGSGVTGIGTDAFADCQAMTAVTLPDSLVSIGDRAFADSGLKSIAIPAGVVSIGADAFANCEDLILSVFCGSYGEAYAKEEDLAYERLHQAEQWKTTVTEPTCVAKGYTTYTCSVCGDSYMDDFQEPTGEHRYLAVITEPTCAEQGYTTYTCSVCGHSYKSDFQEPTGKHRYLAVVTEPTCAEQGFTTFTCSVCGDSYKGDYREPTGEHVYRDDADTTCEICGHVRELPRQDAVAVYRLYNPYTQEHLLTSEAEKDLLLAAGWSLDGLAWKAPTSGIPVYRLYNPYGDFHFYSTSQEEIDSLTPLGWTVDGAVSFSATAETGSPVYRLFNPYAETNYHLFTASQEERDWLASLGWKIEGVAWYCAKD